jgi:beta-glucosidase
MTVSIDVRNTGKVTGDQVVQVYTHQRSGSSSWPGRELKGFRRITLKPGERKMVELKLDTNELGFWSPQTHKWSIEPGTFDLWMGTDAAANEHTTFEVLPQ